MPENGPTSYTRCCLLFVSLSGVTRRPLFCVCTQKSGSGKSEKLDFFPLASPEMPAINVRLIGTEG